MLDISKCIQEKALTGDWIAISVPGVVNELIKELNVVTVIETNEILKYANGKYVGNGLQLVSQVLARDLSTLVNCKNKIMYSKQVKNEIIDLLKDRTYVSLKDFDTELETINLHNKIYNWKTGEVLDHTPMYLSRIQLPIDYDPDANCDKLEEVLRDIIQPEDFIKMLEFISHIFYKKYEIQTSFILYGPGGTGKSAFLGMLDALVGVENCSAVPFDEIDRLFSRMSLCGKLINKCGELDNAAIKRTLIFKALTSGTDLIEAEKKYCDPFRFVNFAKLIFATNSLPKVFDDTDGFYRRVEILLFLRKFRPEEYNQERMDAMTDPKQLSGLFNICIKRLPALLERHAYTNASNVEDIREKYRGASDPIQAFSEDHIVPCPDGKVSCDEMYELYTEYCKNFKVKPIHSTPFRNKISNTIRSMREDTMLFNRRKICCWSGVRLI